MMNNQQANRFFLPNNIPDIVWEQLALYEKRATNIAKYFFEKLASQVADWPRNLTTDDFISLYSQEKNYILALLARDTYWNSRRNTAP